ncbi:FecR family protein [Rhodospirillum rubrum]|uniref:FecR family protein n=1 Tax=Rhodospirillum rubrum TaxID=1085 RepID=UPI00003C2BFD|nr:FecR family protein [Rhodospirillum rubrum]
MKQAAIWHARLREDDRHRKAFALWLGEDPRKAEAFRQTERLWAALEAPTAALATDGAALMVRRQRRPPIIWRRSAGRRVALAVVLALGLVLAPRGQGLIDSLRADDVTAPGERRSLVLADGSVVALNTDSALAVAMGGDHRRLRLFRGEAWFEVAHDARRPFVVETGDGTVTVTGTRFNLRIDEAGTRVSLSEGRVELSPAHAAGQVKILRPGEQAVVGKTAVGAIDTFDATAVTGWRRGQIVFYDTALRQVVAELNRYRRGPILLARRDLADLRVSGVFDVSDPEGVLAALTGTLPVRMTKVGGLLVVLR